MNNKLTREECLELLRTRVAELEELPKKSDFSEAEVARIKAYFGPWPRALEAAGLKTPILEDRKTMNREKRARAQRRQREINKDSKI